MCGSSNEDLSQHSAKLLHGCLSHWTVEGIFSPAPSNREYYFPGW